MLKILNMPKGWKICAMFLFTITVMFPLLSAAPLDPRVDTNAIDDLKDGQEGNVPEHDQRDSKLSFDLSNMVWNSIDVSGSVTIQEGSVGHKLEIDVNQHSHEHPKDGGHHHQHDMVPTDCQWSEYSDWSSCSASCGEGTRHRERNVATPAKAGGNPCVGEKVETELCNTGPCTGFKNNEEFPCSFIDSQLVAIVEGDGQLSPHDTSALYQWENNIIPYFFTSTSDKDKKLFRSIMDMIEEETCFKFEKITKTEYEDKKKHSLEIETGSSSCSNNCRGDVAKVPYSNRLKLKSRTQVWDKEYCESQCGGFILHELMHALGVGHTHTRKDRDKYITVNEANLYAEGVESFFEPCTDCKLYPDVPYDCDSIMHIGTHFKDRELFKPKNVTTCRLKEQPKSNDGPEGSDLDWTLLNIIGKCLTSPGYPHNYPHNSHTKHSLSVADGHKIEIIFREFDVENDRKCYDYLQFFDANSNLVGNKICGQSLPEKLTISTSTASAHFHSDSSVNKKGYKFFYQGRKGALIFLHGLDIGLSVLDCNEMKAELPLHGSVKVVCPEATEDRNFCLINRNPLFKLLSLITGTNPKSWYDMCEFPGGEGENRADLQAAFERMEKQIDDLKNEGIPSENIVLVGYSQGGSLALYTALHSKHKLGGVIGVATWLPLLTKEPPTSVTTINADIPIFHVNAKDDPRVPENVAYDTKEELSKVIKDYTFELVNVHGDKHLDIHKNTCFWSKMINWLLEKELLVLNNRPSAPTCP